MDNVNPLFDSPIFICGAPRSGTTLLLNLLDGHPNLMIFPHELHFLEHYRKKMHYPPDFFKTKFLELIPQSLYCNKNSLSQHNHYMFRQYGPGSEFDFGYHHFIKFKSVYLESLNNDYSLQSIIRSWARAFYSSNNPSWPDYDPHYFVDKRPLDNEICATELMEAFPGAKFIHLIRDPRGRYASVKKRSLYFPRVIRMMNKLLGKDLKAGETRSAMNWLRLKYTANNNRGIDMVTSGCAISVCSMEMALKNADGIGDNQYLVIRYEDLVKNRAPVMDRIAAFLGIKKHPLLLQQSEWRLPKRAVSSFYDQYRMLEEIDPYERAMQNLYTITSPRERTLLNFYLSHIVETFDYPTFSVSKKDALDSIKVPFKHESVYQYLITRPTTRHIIHQLPSRPLSSIWLDRWRQGKNVQD